LLFGVFFADWGGRKITVPGFFEGILERERPRVFLWGPVCLAAGIGLYFSLDKEPQPFGGLIILGPLLVATLWARRRYFWVSCILWAVLFGVVGFQLALLRTALLATPTVIQKSRPLLLEGILNTVDRTTGGVIRIVLDGVALPTALHPESAGQTLRVRLVIRGNDSDILPEGGIFPGDHIRLNAVVMPPPAPNIPGEFDFGRQLWFKRIGAVGYGMGRIERLSRPPPHFTDLERIRHILAQRVLSRLDGESGGLATALITGNRSGIPEPVAEHMRDAGLAHLLAISGLHMGLFTGSIFYLARLLLACIPGVALRYPIRKWAACLALGGGGIYLLISGGSIPTIRAFIMVAIVFLGILTDRRAISLRLVALAASLILAMTPEALLSVSFQMSFAAVTALVAVYERWGGALGRKMAQKNRGWLWRSGFYLLTVLLTTFVAELAIGPVALYHFNKIVHLGLLANLIAMPVMAIWVMPWIVICLMLMPVGLEALALYPMSLGLELIIFVAGWVAQRPFAVSLLPDIGLAALVLMVLGGLWLALWQSRLRLLGGVLVAAGVSMAFLQHPPDILVDNKGRMIGVVTAEGGIKLSTLQGSRITRESWARYYGQESAEKWDYAGIGGTATPEISCDALSCLFRPDKGQEGRENGFLIALVRDELALREDCLRADIVISLVAVKTVCPRARLVLDRWDFYEKGGHALWLPEHKQGAVVVKTVVGERGQRPWTISPLESFVNRFTHNLHF
tara:strand:+ start:19651 stop:21873 length:2223 start_codon:yes stop_codon:yes gene_type:complete